MDVVSSVAFLSSMGLGQYSIISRNLTFNLIPFQLFRFSNSQALILTRLLVAGAKADADARHKAAIAAVNFIVVQLMCSVYRHCIVRPTSINYTKGVYV